jgi:hypothetical protein
VVRAGGLAEGGAKPVVLAARVEARKELCARAIPTFGCAVGRSCNDRMSHLVVIATDQREGRIGAGLSEDRVNGLLIRSDVRLTLADLVDRTRGTFQRRE